mgnify:FL=1
MRTKTLYTRDAEKAGISRFPNFHRTGNITGMKQLYYGKKRPIGTLRESDLQRIERTRNLLQHGSLNGIHYEKSKLQERFSELERHNGSKTALLQYSCRPF